MNKHNVFPCFHFLRDKRLICVVSLIHIVFSFFCKVNLTFLLPFLKENTSDRTKTILLEPHLLKFKMEVQGQQTYCFLDT